MNKLTPDRLAKIKARADAAQKPWEHINNIVIFAIHARTDIPDLIAEVERLRREQRLWSDGSIIIALCDMEAENARLLAENARRREEVEDEKDAHASTIILRDSMYAEKDAENAHLRAELEAAKRDISEMLQAEYAELCMFCKNVQDEVCWIGNCRNAEWRGLLAGNGEQNG